MAARRVARSPAPAQIAVLPSLIAPVREGACFGGAEIQALAISEALARRGHRIRLIGLPGSSGEGLIPWIVSRGTPILRPGSSPPPSDPGPFPEIFLRLEALAEAGELDALHLHLIDPYALEAADGLARRRPELVVIATLHVAAVFEETAKVVKRLLSAGTPIRFTAPTRFAAESYGAGGRILVVSNGVDTSRIDYIAQAPADRRLIWAGRRSREKGLREALEIAERLGRPIAIMGSAAPEGMSVDDKREIARLSLRAGVEDRGVLPRREVFGALGRAEATLVTSSIPESQSLVAIESLAAGTPVVAFAVGGLAEVIENGRTGFLVPVGDLDAACDAVEEARAISRTACREAACARFEESRSIDRFEAVLRSRSNG